MPLNMNTSPGGIIEQTEVTILDTVNSVVSPFAEDDFVIFDTYSHAEMPGSSSDDVQYTLEQAEVAEEVKTSVASDSVAVPWPPVVVWSHRDAAMLEASEAASLRTDWSTGPRTERVAELRALVVRSMAAALDLSATKTVQMPGMIAIGDVYSVAYHDAERFAAARAIAGAWAALVPPSAPPPLQSFITEAGSIPEAGALPVALVVAGVACVGIQGAVFAYIAKQAAVVIDNMSSRSARSAELIQQTGALTKIVEDHTAREKAEGREIPLNEAQKKAIDALQATASIVAAREPAPVEQGGAPAWAWGIGGAALGAGVGIYLSGKR